MPWETNTSLTALNLSFEARTSGSFDLTFSAAAEGGGSNLWAPKDLRISRNCWTCSVVTACNDGWFVGEVISMTTIALTMSMNCWTLFNVIICSDDDGFGLPGGVVGCASDNGGPL